MRPPIDQPIVKALIDAAIFLEFDASIDADTSVLHLVEESVMVKQDQLIAIVAKEVTQSRSSPSGSFSQ